MVSTEIPEDWLPAGARCDCARHSSEHPAPEEEDYIWYGFRFYKRVCLKTSYQVRLEYYLRDSSTISDLDFLKAVWDTPPYGKKLEDDDVMIDSWRNLYDVAKRLKIHPNRVRAKMRRLKKRELLDGCTCSCRGDLTIMPKGGKMLLMDLIETERVMEESY